MSPPLTLPRLQTWAREQGVEVSDDGWARLERLMGLWQQYGRAINLVGATDPPTLLEHVQEGLQCVACVESQRPVDSGCRWIDVGSGGGLPGLVVAAVRPCEMSLVEPRERRAAFLDLGLAAVGQRKGRVIRGRWERSTWNQVGVSEPKPRDQMPFFVLSSRAVFSPERWLEEAFKPGFAHGIVLCHVDLAANRVGEKKPRVIVRGHRWAVAAVALESGG